MNKVLRVFKDNHYTLIKLNEDQYNNISIGRKDCHFRFDCDKIEINIDEHNFRILDKNLSYNRLHSINDVFLIIIDDEYSKRILFEKVLTFGSLNDNINSPLFNDKLNAIITIDGNRTYLEVFEDEFLYINFERVNDTKIQIKDNDIINVSGVEMLYIKDNIIIKSNSEIQYNNVYVDEINADEDKTSNYRLSPRIIYSINEENIVIETPVTHNSEKKGLLSIIIPPIIMLFVTLLIAYFMRRGLYVIMSLAATVMSVVKSILDYREKSKKEKEFNEKRNIEYGEYLIKKSKEINERINEISFSKDYHYPNNDKILKMINNNDRRIYERQFSDNDFLEFRVGSYTSTTPFKVVFNTDEVMSSDDHLVNQAKEIVDKCSTINNVPVLLDLKESAIGLIGKREISIEIAKSILLQSVFFHSYRNLEVIIISKDYEIDNFKFLNWTRHIHLSGLNIRGYVYNEETRDQILSSFSQMLTERRNSKNGSNEEIYFSPQYVFIISNPELIAGHSIMQHLSDGSEIGVHCIYICNTIEELPNTVENIILNINNTESKLLIKNKISQNIIFKPNIDFSNYDLATSVRQLYRYNHVSNFTSSIPTVVGFLDLYDVKRVEQLDLKTMWNTNQAYKSLEVPLGYRTKEDKVYLNLHENAHGPHGLIAGTTGSGKSEIIQSYIISLATSFHPWQVGFVLIDYKGGGMANQFKNLPHLSGTVTNLDGNDIDRAIELLQSELKRRQVLFAKEEVNSINEYHKKFENNSCNMEILQHLFIISDEFAELKKDRPDFIEKIVSAARIGRSLGIHLILATQKPTGVVDGQIWSNSKFKLALKVASDQDSKEILGTNDAAQLVEPGRAYLQVGNNEIYELFQSAWSGMPYNLDKEDSTIDNRMYILNEFGRDYLISKDLSGIDNSATNSSISNELEVVLDYISDYFKNNKIKRPKITFLPSLESNIYKEFEKTNKIELGICDIPSKQLQLKYELDLRDCKNVMVIGETASGKTTFLQSLMLRIASTLDVENARIFIIDCGNVGLLNFSRLKHVSDYITVSQVDKISKVQKHLAKVYEYRKNLFASKKVSSIEEFNEMNEGVLPYEILIIDKYELIQTEHTLFYEFIEKFSKDCSSVGINIILSVEKSTILRSNVQSNFKTKIVLKLGDKNDYIGITGNRVKYYPTKPGQGLIMKYDTLSLVQYYNSVQGETKEEKTTSLVNSIEKINEFYPESIQHPGLKLLPETLLLNEFIEYKSEKEIYIGLDNDEVAPFAIDLSYGFVPIIGHPKTGKTNILKTIIEMCGNSINLVAIDSDSLELINYSKKCEYLTMENDLNEYFSTLLSKYESLQAKLKELKLAQDFNEIEKFMNSIEKTVILVDGFKDFIANINTEGNKVVTKLVESYSNLGITFIITGNTKDFTLGYSDFEKYIKNSRSGILLCKNSEQQLLTTQYSSIEESLELGMSKVLQNDEIIKVMIPEV